MATLLLIVLVKTVKATTQICITNEPTTKLPDMMGHTPYPTMSEICNTYQLRNRNCLIISKPKKVTVLYNIDATILKATIAPIL